MESQAQVRLVFAGELIEGHGVDDAMRCFGELARLQGERLAAVFSGRRTVLKKVIDREEADRYVARLRRIGMHVLMEPLEPPPTPSAPVPFVSDPVLSPMTGPSPLATGPLHSFLSGEYPGAWTHPPASTAPRHAGLASPVVAGMAPSRTGVTAPTDTPKGAAALSQADVAKRSPAHLTARPMPEIPAPPTVSPPASNSWRTRLGRVFGRA